jgi:glyoxylase-like metal-dependent hydrolase (beta-lactamase superfamily II)
MKARSFALLSFLNLSACGGAKQHTQAIAPQPPAVAVAAPAAAPKLQLKVVTGSPEGFLVNSTLITGDKDAVLIDAQFRLEDGKAVADAIRATGKNLTTVYVTHFHPDHYFGFAALKDAFPNAKLVALPSTVGDIQKSWQDKVKTWKPVFKDSIPSEPVIPEPLEGTSIDLEGEKLEIVGPIQGDAADNSYVWIPSLRAVVAGDIVYDSVFPWTAETTPEGRKAWAASLDKIAALKADVVVPGHQTPDKKQDPSDVEFTRLYLQAYDALATSKTPLEVQSKIKAKYPDTALDAIVKIGSEAAFKKTVKAKKRAKKPSKTSE